MNDLDVSKYEFVTIDVPYSDYEKELIGKIGKIKRDYQQEIEPILKMLADSRAMCAPKYMFIPKRGAVPSEEDAGA